MVTEELSWITEAIGKREAGDGQSLQSPLSTNGNTPSEQLSIALLSYRSNPYSGGQGIYVKYLSRELVKLGHSVDVISGKPYPDLSSDVNLVKLPGLNLFETDDPFTEFEFNYIFSPLELFEWVSRISGGFPEPLTFGQRAVRYLSSNGGKYDVIHDNQSLSYGLLQLKRMGFPVLATIHHPITVDRRFDLKNASSKLLKWAVKRWYVFLKMQKDVLPELPHLIAVSESSLEQTIRDFKVSRNSISVVYNGIDTSLFKPLPQIQRQPFRIMTTASADMPLKGLKYLLKAMARLKIQYPELELVIVGELNENGETDHLIERLNLRDSIQFFSEITHRKMVELYATASLAVVPSLYEGFGLPAGEAMACEVPLVSTKGGALPEVVGESGILVEPGDSAEMAEAIRTLLENPDQRRKFGKRGRDRVEEKFSWTNAAKQTSAIYQQLISYANNTN